jgi:ABC-2 type transport system ATP-binding protein
MEYAVSVTKLQKSFGTLRVLQDVNFNVKRGEILALLGPNGAGKTTTVNILSTLLQPDKGKAEIIGYDVVKKGAAVRANIGLTGQFAAVDEYLTGRENVEMIGKLYHMKPADIAPRASALIEQFDLVDAADRPARTYSGGMKRRLDLAMSLVASPAVLFLDEPTTGLDPRSRLALWRMIKDLAKNGTSILLTTQYMEEAEYLADNVIVLDHGRIIAEGTVNELKAKAGSQQIELSFRHEKELLAAQKLLKDSTVAENGNNELHLPAKDGTASLKTVLQTLEKAGINVDTASVRRPTLDDVFLALTGHTAEFEEEKPAKKGKK